MTREERADDPIDAALDFEARLTLALEAAPVVQIPEGFTARVMNDLPARRVPTHLTKTHYGRNAMLISILLLCILLAASAFVTPRESWLVAQWIFFAQLACIAVGFTLRPWTVIWRR